MSRSAAAMNPGQTNRRFILLAITLGLIGAVLVYVAFSRDSGGGGGGLADTAVVLAKNDIPARTRITPEMLEVVLVPQDIRSQLAYEDPNAVVGQITRFPIAANEQVLSSKIVATSAAATGRALSYVVPPGKRGFAINASEVQNAGGLILPGDYVDVIVVYEAFLVRTILQNVEVLSVSQTVVDVVPEATPSPNGQRVRNSEAKPLPDAATVTLALTPEEVQLMYLAETNGSIRLAVRRYGDTETPPVDFMTQFELLPRNVTNPFQR